MLSDLFYSLKTLIQLFYLCWKNKVSGLKYPLVNHIEGGFYFYDTKKEVNNLLFNLLKENPIYQKVIKPHFGNTPLIVVASIKRNKVCISLFRPVRREMQNGLTTIGSDYNKPKNAFEFVLRDGLLLKPVSNTPESWTRKIGYFQEDPVASFEFEMTERSLREVEHFIYIDWYVQEDTRIEVVHENFYAVERLFMNGELFSSRVRPSITNL
tara:strand:+ start:1481 stop:2113 length:633 start_codon:yes stop_codon:yes gene_type:complete